MINARHGLDKLKSCVFWDPLFGTIFLCLVARFHISTVAGPMPDWDHVTISESLCRAKEKGDLEILWAYEPLTRL